MPFFDELRLLLEADNNARHMRPAKELPEDISVVTFSYKGSKGSLGIRYSVEDENHIALYRVDVEDADTELPHGLVQKLTERYGEPDGRNGMLKWQVHSLPRVADIQEEGFLQQFYGALSLKSEGYSRSEIEHALNSAGILKKDYQSAINSLWKEGAINGNRLMGYFIP
ncbi:MAG: hypothetical protein HGA85_04565 [Nanoarchaeota archaeon]|nr:hypothetical protein [Nanoarchaeota archaeon]